MAIRAGRRPRSTDQAPLFHVPGPHGGWFILLPYGFGFIDVPMQELRKLFPFGT